MARANPHRVPSVEAGELNIDYDLYLRITNQCGWPRWAAVVAISPALCDDLLAYLMCTSPDRARLIAELTARNPGVADLLMDVEPSMICELSWRSRFFAKMCAVKGQKKLFEDEAYALPLIASNGRQQ